jgi:hypothetical protein
MDKVREVTGRMDLTGTEGPLTITQALVDAYKKDESKKSELEALMGVQLKSVGDVQNTLSRALEIFNRRALRAFAAVFGGQRLLGELMEDMPEAAGTAARATEEYENALSTLINRLSNAASNILQMVTQSGALQRGLNVLEVAVQALSFVLSLIPDNLLTAIVLCKLWSKVIWGGLIKATTTATLHLWQWIAALTVHNRTEYMSILLATKKIVRWAIIIPLMRLQYWLTMRHTAAVYANTVATMLGITVSTRAIFVQRALAFATHLVTLAVHALNIAWRGNPIGIAVMVIVGAVLLLWSVLKGIGALWRKLFPKQKASVTYEATSEGFTGDEQLDNMMGNAGANLFGEPSVASPVSGRTLASAKVGTQNITNLHVDARGATNPHLVKSAVREAFSEHFDVLFHENRTAEVVG